MHPGISESDPANRRSSKSWRVSSGIFVCNLINVPRHPCDAIDGKDSSACCDGVERRPIWHGGFESVFRASEGAYALVMLAVQCIVFRPVDFIFFKTLLFKNGSGGLVGLTRTMTGSSGSMMGPRRLDVLRVSCLVTFR